MSRVDQGLSDWVRRCLRFVCSLSLLVLLALVPIWTISPAPRSRVPQSPANIPTRLAASEWLQRFVSDDVQVYFIAQWEALQQGPAMQTHMSELLQFIQTASGHTREERNNLRQAFETLRLMGRAARPAVPHLVEWLSRSGEGLSVQDMMCSLSDIGATAGTADVFFEHLNGSDEIVSLCAAQALDALDSPSPEAVRLLLQKLPMFKWPHERMLVARSLAALQPWSEREAEVLNGYLEASDPSLQYAAAWLWQQVFPQQKVDRRRIYAAISHTTAVASCDMTGRSLQLVMKSFSGESYEDDYTVLVLDSSREPIFAGFEGWLAWFSFVPRSGKPSPCDIEAFYDNQGNLVVPMQTNNRPFLNQMAGLLYDPRINRILASEDRLGEVPERAKVERLQNGFSFQEELQPSDTVSCERGRSEFELNCGDFRGREIRSSTDEWILVWWDVVHVPGVEGWQKLLNLSRTWQMAPVRKYFSDEDEFARAFRLDPTNNTVGIYWYRRVLLDNGEQWFCVTPARELQTDDSWCRQVDTHLLL